MKFEGAIFDLDGVITDTATMHAKAWKIMFDKFLKKHNKKFIEFDKENDYLKYVDGKPRIKGTKSFLESRKINLKLGKISDSESVDTIYGLANKKNRIFLDLLSKQKPKVYFGTVSLIKKLKRMGIKVGVISSSKNCKKILEMSGLIDLFKIIIDGNVSNNVGLSGKPDPDIFLYAAKKLKVNPEQTIVFEDALSGVEAGKKGNFGLIVGIQRNDFIHFKDADFVVKSLVGISVGKLNELFGKQYGGDSNWNLRYNYFLSEKEKTRESLTTIGNGYIGTRGCFETQCDSDEHYPGCYIAGIYNELNTKINGREIVTNSLVNCPNWLLFKIKIGNKFINPFKQEILDYDKNLDLKKAVLYHKLIFKDKENKITKIESRRFSSMDNPHLSIIEFSITPVNYSGNITIQSLIDGDIKNNNVSRYKRLKSKHLKIILKEKVGDSFLLHTRTNKSGYDLVFSFKNVIDDNRSSKLIKSDKLIGEEFTYYVKKEKTVSLKKIVSVFTSRESSNPKEDSLSLLKNFKNFKSFFGAHIREWEKIWDRSDFFIRGDKFSQNILRSYIYNLFSSYSLNVVGLDVGILARGLTGESYHGHVFWDDIYMNSFYLNCFPRITRESLVYRYNRLEQAKKYADKNCYLGAMYPWQSADTGKEETQKMHLNPLNNSWGVDFSRNQRHVSIAVFYSFLQFFNYTGDKKFLEDYGAEVMIEIARFWADIVKYDERDNKFHIEGVLGPDEFHEKYPWSRNPGLIDNAYTNIMVSWLLRKVIALEKILPEKTVKKLGITKREIEKWRDIGKKINVVVNNGIIMQFKDFDKLKNINLDKYRKKYKKIERMDRILKSEGKSPDDYKVIKQPDVLMIFYILEFEEAISILRDIGVNIRNPKIFIKNNYDYYLSMTTHGSTLSKFICDAVGVNLKYENKLVWKLFKDSLEADIIDTQNGTTQEGLHLGLMAGTLEIVRKYFAGIKICGRGIIIKPWFPLHWKELKFRITHQKKLYLFHFILTEKKVEITLEAGADKSFVIYGEKKYFLKKGKSKKIILKNFNF